MCFPLPVQLYPLVLWSITGPPSNKAPRAGLQQMMLRTCVRSHTQPGTKAFFVMLNISGRHPADLYKIPHIHPNPWLKKYLRTRNSLQIFTSFIFQKLENCLPAVVCNYPLSRPALAALACSVRSLCRILRLNHYVIVKNTLHKVHQSTCLGRRHTEKDAEAQRDGSAAFSVWGRRGRHLSIRTAHAQELPISL